jgi:hypothetical protein
MFLADHLPGIPVVGKLFRNCDSGINFGKRRRFVGKDKGRAEAIFDLALR